MTPPTPMTPRDTVPASAIALGNFDGVHLGHRRILEALRAHAAAHGLRPLALTFDPHPRHFFAPERKAVLLTPPREKEALIAALGVEVATLPFDAAVAALPAEAFVRDVLHARLGGKAFFLGPDHRFGRGALGDAALLRALCEHAGHGESSVTEIAPVSLDGDIVSSSAIRARIEAGDPAGAAAMLGRPYSLSGEVVRGRERGRLLGFPTANVRPEDPRKILPAFGVYAGHARFDGEERPALANIGLRPTFGEPEPSIEIHIPDGSFDLYGKTVEFTVEAALRPERKFESPEALRSQIARDVENWRAWAAR
jgi:riboflavin kinase/FMN adenylyltransferase